MKNIKEKEQDAYSLMKADFKYKNKYAVPKLQKVVLSVGTGNLIKKDKNKNDFITERLSKISGQKPSLRGAKKSISTFKIRQGDPIGLIVTLRGNRMYSFLDKFFNIALPRTKDFRGINKKAVDNMGNLTIGIKEHTIFPETADEDIKDVFGLSVILVSTAKDKKTGLAFYDILGIPFKKD